MIVRYACLMSSASPDRVPSGRRTKRPRDDSRPFYRYNIGALLRDPQATLERRLHEKLDAVGYADLRRSHGLVFQYIGDGARVVDLAARAQMTKQSMAEIVAYLEERGYVTRSVDPTDRRAKVVRLTEKGAASLPAALKGLAEIEAEWKALFGDARLERLRGELAALREVLEKRYGTAFEPRATD